MQFPFSSSLVFQKKTEQQMNPSLHISSVYTRLAVDTIKMKASLSQMDLFVLKPTSKLTSSPLSFQLLLLTLADGIEHTQPFREELYSPISCHYGFFMLVKISVCLPSHLTWSGETSDRTILEKPSPKRKSDFRLKNAAGCSEYVTQVVQTARTVAVHQSVYTHAGCPQKWNATLAPCGSLQNLMIYAQIRTSTHTCCLETVYVPDRLSNFHGNSGFPTA